ncbi:hypothetical protein CDCA_CDCA15G4101 [Cyanidium caldarium]|uniref:Tubulin-specific chaperone A n=1 Tax=Cyanidium caldarium TaxID=2771 RepID=A0AAV9J1C2_CYACA|nr:hypothetical protein CDCA_CDCA15G4101 [Cyanidium caldarium]
MENALERELRIRRGVVDRTLKDLRSYEEEVRQLKKRVVEAGADDPAVQWERAVRETEMMVPEAKLRLSQAVDELNACVVRAQEGNVPEEELGRARGTLAEARRS